MQNLKVKKEEKVWTMSLRSLNIYPWCQSSFLNYCSSVSPFVGMGWIKDMSSTPGLDLLIRDWRARGDALEQLGRRHRAVGSERRSRGDEREGHRGGHAASEAAHRPLCPGGEQRLHGAHVAHPRHHAHRHLLLLHHRLLLSQGAATALSAQLPTNALSLCAWSCAATQCDVCVYVCFLFLWLCVYMVRGLVWLRFRCHLWSSNVRRRWPGGWSLMAFTSQNSHLRMTSKGSGTDWSSTRSEFPRELCISTLAVTAVTAALVVNGGYRSRKQNMHQIGFE